MSLPAEGYGSRVRYVNHHDQEFFTLTDCEMMALDGSGRDWKAPVLMLARRHIRLIVPPPTAPDPGVPGRSVRAWSHNGGPLMLYAILNSPDKPALTSSRPGASPRSSTPSSAEACGCTLHAVGFSEVRVEAAISRLPRVTPHVQLRDAA